MKYLLYLLLFVILFDDEATAQTKPKARWAPGFGVEANRGIPSLQKAFSAKTTSSFYNQRFCSHFDFVAGVFRVQKGQRLFATALLAGWGEMYGADGKYSMSSVPAFTFARYTLLQAGIFSLSANGRLGARYFYSNRETELNNRILPEYGLGLSAGFAFKNIKFPISLSVAYLQTGHFQFISTSVAVIPIFF